MTLLAAITNRTTPATPAAHLVLTPASPPPATTSALPTSIPPAAWSLSPTSPALAAAASSLAASLSAPALTAQRLHALLASFLAALAHSLSLPPPSPNNLPLALLALTPYLPSTLAALLASAAARLSEHSLVLALADSRAIPHPLPDLIPALADAARPDLVCAVLRQAADLRASSLLAALRCFLSPASDAAYDAMVTVKARWKDAAVLAVGKCKDKDAGKKEHAVARRAALLLMMGHDGFTAPEVCLHHLFASRTVDSSMVLAAAVSELDGDEVAGLARYLAKWVGKYWRFLEARPCPEGMVVPGLEELCESVPSVGAVTRAMGLVMDQHFSHLVLNAELREDLCAAEVMVKELAVEAEASGPILDLLHRMQQEV